jgi:CTP:phosphocholine cytidylyltransferase-like protein
MIKKAILPVAGLGTRFLPASKSIPKKWSQWWIVQPLNTWYVKRLLRV